MGSLNTNPFATFANFADSYFRAGDVGSTSAAPGEVVRSSGRSVPIHRLEDLAKPLLSESDRLVEQFAAKCSIHSSSADLTKEAIALLQSAQLELLVAADLLAASDREAQPNSAEILTEADSLTVREAKDRAGAYRLIDSLRQTTEEQPVSEAPGDGSATQQELWAEIHSALLFLESRTIERTWISLEAIGQSLFSEVKSLLGDLMKEQGATLPEVADPSDVSTGAIRLAKQLAGKAIELVATLLKRWSVVAHLSEQLDSLAKWSIKPLVAEGIAALLGTAKTREDVAKLIAQLADDRHRYACQTDIERLVRSFSEEVDEITSFQKLLRGLFNHALLKTLFPKIRLVEAALHTLLCLYVILLAADYVDTPNPALSWVDLEAGVRRIVAMHVGMRQER